MTAVAVCLKKVPWWNGSDPLYIFSINKSHLFSNTYRKALVSVSNSCHNLTEKQECHLQTLKVHHQQTTQGKVDSAASSHIFRLTCKYLGNAEHKHHMPLKHDTRIYVFNKVSYRFSLWLMVGDKPFSYHSF